MKEKVSTIVEVNKEISLELIVLVKTDVSAMVVG